ncbi:MAG: extensin family protein [Hyphomicrobiaceae bacterium]|nr:extensin family protein [Hyphomicrobiaceae bacterium]
MIAALRECVRLLAPLGAEVEVSEPLKQDQCGTPAPVLVRRIGSGANKVEISPPAVVNCPMVVGLHTWVEKALQPAAQEAFGARIARLRGTSGYACRNRVGSHSHTDRLSEHAFANAIDISGFETTDGRTIDVAGSWGPTVREQQAQRAAALRAKESAPAADEAPELTKAGRQRDHKISAIANAASDKPKQTSVQTAELQSRGKGGSAIRADGNAIPAAGHEVQAKTAEARFLRRLHKSACDVFGTVLGPEANAAHRDHFHLDLAHRRHSAYCQ